MRYWRCSYSEHSIIVVTEGFRLQNCPVRHPGIYPGRRKRHVNKGSVSIFLPSEGAAIVEHQQVERLCHVQQTVPSPVANRRTPAWMLGIEVTCHDDAGRCIPYARLQSAFKILVFGEGRVRRSVTRVDPRFVHRYPYKSLRT